MMHEEVNPINRKAVHPLTLPTEKLRKSSASDRDQLGVHGPAQAHKPKESKNRIF